MESVPSVPPSSCLLVPLHLFETSVLAQFLTAKSKLLTFCRLSKSWYYFVHKNYFWHEFPRFNSKPLNSNWLSFLNKFNSLEGIHFPNVPL